MHIQISKQSRRGWGSLVFGLLGLAAAGVAVLLYLQTLQKPSTQQIYRRSHAFAVEYSARLAKMEAATDTMVKRLDENPKAGFPTFLSISETPLFLFRDTTLVFWSHFDLVPSTSVLKGKPARLIRDKGGVALLYVREFIHQKDGKQFYAVARQPLFARYPVSNAFLKPSWVGKDLSGIRFENDSLGPSMAPILDKKGGHVAGVEVLPEAVVLVHEAEQSLLIATSIALLFFLVSIGLASAYFAGKGRYALALLLWAIALALVKGTFSLGAIRAGLDEYPIFSPRMYASSVLAPTLGDLLITTFLLAVFSWAVFRYFFRTRWMFYTRGYVFWVSAGVTLGYLLMILGAHRVMRSLYLHSQIVLDVAKGFRLSWERVGALGIFITIAFTLFFSIHVVARVLTRFKRVHRRDVYKGIALGTALMAVLLYVLDSRAWYLELLALLSLLAWLHLHLPEYLFRLRYQTYFYLFSIAILAAATATQAYMRYRDRIGYIEREQFSKRLLAQGDPLAEELIEETSSRLAADTTLRQLIGDSLDYIKAEEYLRRVYTDIYLDQYTLEIGVFDHAGDFKSGVADLEKIPDVRRFASSLMAPTKSVGVYFAHMPSDDIFKRYLSIVSIPALPDSLGKRQAHAVCGFVTLDLKMRRLAETSVFATLLVNGPSQAPLTRERYSYAVYDTTGILLQDGLFNYERGFTPRWLQQKARVETHRKDGWVHALFMQPDGQQVVVSAPDTYLRDAFANFSFLLLVLVAFILAFVIGSTVRQQAVKRRLTFAGKIQIYLNAAFFLPLTVFGLVSFTLVELSLRADLNAGYLLRARNAAKSLEPMIEQLQDGRMNDQEFAKKIDDMARFTGLNASLFTHKGKLLYSSHPLIYRKGILSPYINPEALTVIVDEGLHESLLDERIGKLRYSTAYVAVQIPKSRKIVGVLAVPFFEAGSELESQLSNAVSTVVSSFTAVFILFMVLSYFASQILVVPLKLITARLKRTTLGETEPLIWPTKDEIGLLVEGYNGMLRKLEASRAALATSEKESAWREMAQQVAHEIKNPLTPMKLTVQQLQRVLNPNLAAPDVQKLQRPLAGLLEQIENLSDIAGSFSAFARMPQPKTELFDLARVTRRTTELHRSDALADVEVVLPESPQEAFILGDEGIFQGIINNLIINGVQAVPSERRPTVKVILERMQNGRLRLSVQDNGEGIPQEVRTKIFLPNFSTKFAGSGIGLALAKRGVEHAHGSIWFETEMGVGSVFYIEVQEQEKNSAR